MTAETITREPWETDNAPAAHVLVGVLRCALAWVPEARIIGNVRAGDIARAVTEALDEPARLAAARAEGVREGVEAARQVALHWLASLETDRDRATSTLAHAEAAQMNQRVCGIAIVITAISALSPAPAEPSAPVAPDWPTRCAALEADGIAARKRVAALEAENAALKARVAELVEGLRPFAEEADEWEGINVRAGDSDPVFIGPDDVMDTGKARFSVGDLRRARALLQCQGGADA